MKIATQNLILIPPIFLLLALLASALIFFSERAQIRWGFHEEAHGFALVVAEFIDATAVERLADSGPAVDDETRLHSPLQRLVGFGDAERIRVLDTRVTPPRVLLDIGDTRTAALGLSDDVVARVKAGEVVVHEPDTAAPVLESYAQIARDGRHIGTVAVQTSLAALHSQSAQTIRDVITISLALLVVGAVVSMVISRFISVEIGRLTRSVRAFASGQYDAKLQASSIQEVAIVGSTFDIMGSVLQDTTERSRRAMVEIEQFGIEPALERFYAERFAGAVAEDCGAFRVAIDRLGPVVQENFWFVRTVGDDCYAVLGRTTDTHSLSAALTSSALVRFLRESLAAGLSARDALAESARLFRIHSAVLLHWRDGARLEILRMDAEARITGSALAPASGLTTVLTTLDDAAEQQVLRYVAAHEFTSPEDCVHELQQFFRGTAAGGVLALQARDTSARARRAAAATPGEETSLV